MREYVEKLQERLADSESQVADLKADLAAGQKLLAARKAKAAQERGQSEERLAVVTKKYNAVWVEELGLKDALGLSHAEETVEVAEFCTKWMASEALGNVVELCR